jgi:hypothetical protein
MAARPPRSRLRAAKDLELHDAHLVGRERALEAGANDLDEGGDLCGLFLMLFI